MCGGAGERELLAIGCVKSLWRSNDCPIAGIVTDSLACCNERCVGPHIKGWDTEDDKACMLFLICCIRIMKECD